MASKTVTSDIASLETQAASILADARAKAADLLRAANQEASGIGAAPSKPAGVEAECAALVDAARQKSRAAVEASAKDAERLRAKVRGEGAKAFQALVRKIEGMVRGAR